MLHIDNNILMVKKILLKLFNSFIAKWTEGSKSLKQKLFFYILFLFTILSQ